MSKPKILPYLGAEDVHGHIRFEQESAIQRMCWEFTEGSMGVVNASNMDTGKTLQAAEVVHRLGFGRVLYVGVKDTFDQWAERLAAQSDGAIVLRRMDGELAGRANWAAFMRGDQGHFFTGSQYLTAQDWEHPQQKTEHVNPLLDGLPATRVDKTKTGGTGSATFVASGKGVVEATKPWTERKQKNIFKKALIQRNPVDLIVFDEVHVIANRTSIGRRTVRTIPTKRKLAMSGTAFGNKFENAWSITRWVWDDLGIARFSEWKEVWCALKVVDIGHGKETLEVKGEKEEGAFVQTLPCYIRIDGELEVPAAEIVEVELLPQQRADYDDLEQDLLVWLNTKAGRRAAHVEDFPITLRTRLRTAALGVLTIDDETGKTYLADDCQSTKLFGLRQIVDRPSWQGQQVGIYTHSKEFAKIVVKRMRAAGYNAVEWSGDITTKQRTEIKRAFLAGEIQYLVSVIAAFSTGLDEFQFVCNKVVWISESDNPMLNNQAIKRYFRTGRAAGFEHVKLVAKDTHDAGVLSRNIMSTLAMNASMTEERAAA